MPFTPDMLLVVAILVGSLALFITEKLPMDLVALLVLLALLVTGLVPEGKILSGFSNPATITVACMFILSAGLQRTGVVALMASRLTPLAGQSLWRLVLVVCLACGTLSAFINNTAAVAVMLPVILSLCRERGVSPTRVLMPLSFAAQFGGVCTLVGTSTNLLVHGIMRQNGLPGYGMFDFTVLGLVCFAIGTLYMMVASKMLLPDRAKVDDQASTYGLEDYLTEMRVTANSRLIDTTAGDCELTQLGDLRILEIIRDGQMIWAPKSTLIRADDVLLVRGDVNRLLAAAQHLGLAHWAERKIGTTGHDMGLVEVLLPTQSRLIGRTLSQLDFYWRYHAAVLGIRRHGAVLKARLASIPFEHGDTLLLQGHKQDLQQLARESDFILLQELSSLHFRKNKAYMALAILAGVVGLAALGITSILTTALCGCALLVLTRSLTLQEAYDALDLRVIMLLACLIPLGIAMQDSGTASALVQGGLTVIGDHPHWALLAVYLFTMVLTAAMSNNATAVLMAPLCFSLAQGMGVNPMPFLVAVTFAASTCFTTPVGYQTNAMVYGPGGYQYTDFIKVGLPLNLLLMVVTVWLVPLIWPF